MDQILKHGPAVKKELTDYIMAKRRQSGDNGWLTDFLNRLEAFATSGKLLRGSLLCFSYEEFTQKPPGKDVVRAAAALEMTHSALLIHDDIMDEDELRRGQPSLHRQYQILAKTEGLADSDQLGLNMALGAGDATLFLGFEILNGLRLSSELRTSLTELFINQLIRTCQGQMQDIYLESQAELPSKQTIYDLMKMKTAGYTIALPLQMGALLAEQSKKLLRQLEQAGQIIGTIFQIRDDELGVMGSPAKTGKPIGSDIKQGKKTLLYYFLLDKTTAAERAKLLSIFGNPAIAESDVIYVQQLVKKTGIGDQLGKEVDQLKTRAFRAIDELPLSPNAKIELKDLTEFCARRHF